MNSVYFRFSALVLFSLLFLCVPLDGQTLTGSKAAAIKSAKVLANTLTVTKTADTNDGACNADCSLREAIAAAQAGDTIIFATAGVFAVPQTITVTVELVINKNLTINGTGIDRLSISGNNSTRVLTNSGTTTISNLTVTKGKFAPPSFSSGNYIGGGGIWNSGDLTLTNVIVSRSSVLGPGGPSVCGGGVYSRNRLSLINSTVSDSSADDIGGRTKLGGGICNDSGWILIKGSTVSNNRLPDTNNRGGGIYDGGTTIIINSTISGNKIAGGGLTYGGGIFGNPTIINSTITDNEARRGGGINGNPTVSNSIISGNRTVLGNHGPNVLGTVNSLGYNLFGDTAEMSITGVTTGNYLNQDARLAPLADNGGATKTHATLPDSLARNHGSNALAVDENNMGLLTDQRGSLMPRVSEGTVDIGAYERSVAEMSVSEHNGANIPDGGSFDFGQTPLLNPVFKTFRITNESSEILRFANLRLPAGFTLFGGFPEALGPNSLTTITVRLDADMQGAPSGTLSFDTNDDDENPYNFTITGAVGSPTNTAVASIVPVFSGSLYCTPVILSQRVTFTQPITGLTPENFAVVDVNNSVGGEEVVGVTRENDMSYIVAINVESGGGLLRLAMVNRNGTTAVITNLPYTGPNNTIDASPPTPVIEPLTSLPAQPNSTGNQLTTPDASPPYRWFITSGIGSITSADNLQTITYSVGSAGNVTFRLTVVAANGCNASRTLIVPVYSVTDPVVTNNNDDGPGSLRQAILEATPGSTITFADNVRGTITLTSGELLIEKNLTIRGPGADKLAVSGNNESRVFHYVQPFVFTLEGLTIKNGFADAESPQGAIGGAILNRGATLTLKNAVISDSRVPTGGGGGIGSIFGGGILNVINSTVTGNTAGYAGGIYVAGTATIAGSTISGNSSGYSAGGIYINLSGNLINSTVANNTAVTSAGGIEVRHDATSNQTLNALNSIIAQNTLTGSNPSDGPDVSGRLISQGNNLVGNTAGMTTTGDQTGNIFNPAGGARLAPLGFYGGTMPTHALSSNSLAVGGGNGCVTTLTCSANNPPAALTLDQRGAGRVGNVDIGAFELNNTANGGSFAAQLPAGQLNLPYNFVIAPNNGSFNYTITGGALPNNVNLSINFAPQAVVALSGTPSQAGVFNFAVTAADGTNSVVTNYVLNILSPTAAAVSVSGRVFAGNKRGLANAVVSLTDSNGNTRNARTNPFGYYRFYDIAAGQTVIISVSSKRGQFAPQAVNLTDNMEDLNFYAAPE